MEPNIYLQSRAEEQITWMEQKSKLNQRKYRLIKIIEITAAAAIPFLAGFQQKHPAIPVLTGLMGVLIVILNGLQQLYRYHENWLAYRTTIEALKREKIFFEAGSEPYNDGNAFHKFVQNFEAILANENLLWKSTMQSKVQQK